MISRSWYSAVTVGRWVALAGMFLVGTVATAADDWTVRLDRIRYTDGAGREIDYNFSTGTIVPDGTGGKVIELPASAILGRATGEESTVFGFGEPDPEARTNATLSGGMLSIGISQDEPGENEGLWALGGRGPVATPPISWTFEATFNGFFGTGTPQRPYSFEAGLGSGMPAVEPSIQGNWFTGWYEGTYYANVLAIEARIDDGVNDNEFNSEMVFVPGLNPVTTVVRLKGQVTGGTTFNAWYAIGAGDWVPLWQQTVGPAGMPGLPALSPYVSVETLHMGLADVTLERGQAAADLDSREWGVDIAGNDLTGLEVTTPWGVTVSSDDYLPADWDGEDYSTYDAVNGVEFWVGWGDSMRSMEFSWDSPTTQQWNLLATGNVTITATWDGGSWTGTTNFSSSPMPTQIPQVTFPTPDATGVTLNPTFTWTPWTSFLPHEPGVWWELENVFGNEVWEVDHEPPTTTSGAPGVALLPGTDYRLVVDFHHAPTVQVNGQNVQIWSYLECESVPFRTAGQAPFYEVWGGDTDYRGDLWRFFNIAEDTDYTLLGYSRTSETFNGLYRFYVIQTLGTDLRLDALGNGGETGTFYNGAFYTQAGVMDEQNLRGPIDQQYATVFHYVMIENPGNWNGLDVWMGPPPQPDLGAYWDGPESILAGPGSGVSVPLTIANWGADTAVNSANPGAPWSNQVWLSTDAGLDTNQDTLLRTFELTELPRAGEETRQVMFTAPMDPGTYYLFGVADATNLVNEQSENNNVSGPFVLVVGGNGITSLEVCRGTNDVAVPENCYSVVVSAVQFDRLRLTTPWGEAFDSNDYVPSNWDGNHFETTDDTRGLTVELFTWNGLPKIEVEWEGFDTTKWQALGTGQTALNIDYMDTNWTGNVDFSLAPMPTTAPEVTYPAQDATNVPTQPTFTWTTWTGYDIGRTPGVWYVLDEIDVDREIFEIDHDPPTTSRFTWNPGLLPGTQYEFVVDYHYAPTTTVNGTTISLCSYLESAPVQFTVEGQRPLYEVWAGNQDFTNDPSVFYNVENMGYTRLGYGSGTASYIGNYTYYVISPLSTIQVDALRGSDGNYYNGPLWTAYTTDPNNLLGAPDDQKATVNDLGYVLIQNPDNWGTLTVLFDGGGAPAPDVICTFLGPVVEATPMQPLNLQVRLTNVGNAVASVPGNPAQSWNTAVYVSDDPVFSPATDLEQTGFGITSLAVGATYDGPANFLAPPAPGTYYLFAVADVHNLVPESNETNNVSPPFTLEVTGAVGQPDLTAAVLGPDTINATTGQQLFVDIKAVNSGDGAAVPNAGMGDRFYNQLYISDDLVFGPPQDMHVGGFSLTELAAGAEYSSEIMFFAPQTPGTYYLAARADDVANVTESDETNNWSAPVTLIVGTPPEPPHVALWRGMSGTDVSTRELGVEAGGPGLTRLQVQAPWGAIADSADYLPPGWTGEWFEAEDPAKGLWFEAYMDDGNPHMEIGWDDLTQAQWDAAAAGTTTITAYYAGQTWTGAAGFAQAPMPTQVPNITNPTANATGVPLRPQFTWDPWTNDPPAAPGQAKGVWWELARGNDGPTVNETDDAPANATSWQPERDLAPGREHVFCVDFHYYHDAVVNSANVRSWSYLESPDVYFTTVDEPFAYQVWGGHTAYANPGVFYAPWNTDYVYLGGANTTATFDGAFGYYVIVPGGDTPVAVDAFTDGPGGEGFMGVMYMGDVSGSDELYGAPDGAWGSIGGYLLLQNALGWDRITVNLPVAPSRTWYVTQAGTGDGSSWASPLGNLQDALGAATAGDRIWVAAGRYTPGAATGDTFALVDGVNMFGGFAGTETSPDQRDLANHETILSGDLNGDDDATVSADNPLRGDNCAHVVTARNIGPDTIFDGFTVRDGQAPNDFGAGMFVSQSSVQIRNCAFRHNCANEGGGLYVEWDSAPLVRDSSFTGNRAICGAGLGVWSCAATLNGCTFVNNHAESGGAIYTYDSTLNVDGGSIVSNVGVGDAGGVACVSGSTRVANTVIHYNNAPTGAAIVGSGGGFEVVNCLISGNVATAGASIVNGDDGVLNIVNSTITGNQVDAGGEIDNSGTGLVYLVNTIVWNTPSVAAGAANVRYSCIQGGYAGDGNTGLDPLFVQGPTGAYHLDPASPCVNTGSTNVGVPPVPVAAPTRDLDGNPRDAQPDMGCYEYQGGIVPVERQVDFVSGLNLVGFPQVDTGLNSASQVLAWAPHATAVYFLDPMSKSWQVYTTSGGTDFMITGATAVFIACSQAGSATMTGPWSNVTSGVIASPGSILMCVPQAGAGMNRAADLLDSLPNGEGVWRWLPNDQKWSGYQAGLGGDNFPVEPGTAFMGAVDAPGTWPDNTP